MWSWLLLSLVAGGQVRRASPEGAYVYAGRTCAADGLKAVGRDECERACGALGKTFQELDVTLTHSPGCFAVLSGRWAGNCHFRAGPLGPLGPAVLSGPFPPENRAVCRLP